MSSRQWSGPLVLRFVGVERGPVGGRVHRCFVQFPVWLTPRYILLGRCWHRGTQIGAMEHVRVVFQLDEGTKLVAAYCQKIWAKTVTLPERMEVEFATCFGVSRNRETSPGNEPEPKRARLPTWSRFRPSSDPQFRLRCTCSDPRDAPYPRHDQ